MADPNPRDQTVQAGLHPPTPASAADTADTADTAGSASTADTKETADKQLVEEEDLLIEEVSIDGMCGVY